MKVTIPKNDVIASAQRTYLKGGLHSGALALELTLAAPMREGASFGDVFGEVAEALLAVELPGVMPLVRISGDGARAEAESMLSLIKALRTYGKVVQVVLDGQSHWPSWVDAANWVILRTSTPQVFVVSDEIWYEPDMTGEAIRDINFMPGKIRRQTYMYFNPAKLRLTPEDLAELFIASEHAWCMR